jgi:hypothetical protein
MGATMKVFVYFNLHRKCWSVKALEGPTKGRVVQHADTLMLTDCVFKVSEAGRQRVLRERRKNVHAGVVGTLTPALDRFIRDVKMVTYNPYRAGTFVNKVTGEPIHSADVVLLQHRHVLSGSWTE